ncbi:hypothetical protein [Moraxella lacunata]|uniref:hypothetical protein n=1 Tax=Moraxella lacunata TaxID=477 RepID=UPI003EE38AD8
MTKRMPTYICYPIFNFISLIDLSRANRIDPYNPKMIMGQSISCRFRLRLKYLFVLSDISTDDAWQNSMMHVSKMMSLFTID